MGHIRQPSVVQLSGKYLAALKNEGQPKTLAELRNEVMSE